MTTATEIPEAHRATYGSVALERGITAAFAGALVVVIALSLAMFDTARRALDASRSVARTLEVLEALDGVEGALAQVESAARGFAMTAADVYLAQRDNALSRFESRVQRLDDLLVDSSAQQARWRILRDRLDVQLSLLDRMAALRQTEGLSAAQAFLRKSFSAESMRAIRMLFDEMRGEEQHRLAERTMVEERRRGLAVVAGFVLTAVFVALFTVGFRAIRRELARRRAAEQEIVALNRDLQLRARQLEAANKELEGFSYSVSHDLRAPLRAIVGFAKMLQEDHEDKLDAEARRKISVIQAEAQRMGLLIDDLLAFSRMGRKAMQVSEFDMTELARATYEGLNGHHENPKAEFHLGVLPRAKGDRVLLGQVWANLLSNALKFSSKRRKPLIEVSAISDEKEHVYFVRDNGAGFDPRYQSKLFGVFQRLHDASEFNGTGVGLALVQRIVARHGGRVWADGKPDAGATFYFTLPKEQAHGNV